MSKRGEILCLSIATTASMAGALVSMVIAILSPIAFDKAGSLLNPLAWVAFLMMISLWVVCILGPFGAWIMYGRGNQKMAWLSMAAPLWWAIVMTMMLIMLR